MSPATRRFARFLALAFAGVGAATGGSTIGAGPGCSADPPKKPAGEPIVIGVSLGLSESLAGTAAPVRDAIRVAEGQINANGGVLGRPVSFDIQDDKSDANGAIAVANDFVARKLPAVIGPIGSGQVVKVAKLYADAQMIELSPTATSVELTDLQPIDDRWFFRTTPADDFQAAAILKFTQITPTGFVDGGAPEGGAPAKCSKLVIVNIDNSYGNKMGELVEKNFPRVSGGTVAFREVIPEKPTSDYLALVGKIINAVPGCMAIIAYEDTGSQVITELKADPKFSTNLESKGFFIIGTDGIFTDEFLKQSAQDRSNLKSKNSAVGVYGTNPDTQPGTKEYNEFRTIYASAFPLAPGVVDAPAFSANAYDAAVLIALAIQRAGTLTDRKLVRDSLREVSGRPGAAFSPASLGAALAAVKDGTDIDYKGASGAVDLEPNGNVKSGFIIWKAIRQPDEYVGYSTQGRFTLDDLQGQLQ